MDMAPVQSSSISAVGHDADTGTLRVRFTNGSTYDYAGVPAEVYEELRNAPSVGKTFATLVRAGGFSHTKIS